MQRLPTCPKCSSAFLSRDPGGRSQRRPLLLDCGHTFCESCLQQQLKEHRTGIVCAICKVETTFPEGEANVKNLCPDRYMLGQLMHNEKIVLQQELKKLSPALMSISQKKRLQSGCSDSSDSSVTVDTLDQDKLCKECGKKPATSHCPNCVCNMCGPCFQRVHSMSTTLKLHQAQPIPEEGQLEVSQMCKIHENRPIEYYCEDDETIICSRCVIMGTHKGHNISSIEDKNRLIVNEMEPNLQVANQVFRRLKRIDKDLESQLPDVKKETEPALTALHSHFQHLHGMLQIQEQSLQKEILNVFRAGIEPIEKLREDLHKEQKQLEVAIKCAHRIMNNNDEVIVNAKDILDKLIHAKEIPCILEQKEEMETTQKICFVADTSLDSPGQVRGQVTPRFMMWSLAEKPEMFTDDRESLASNLSDVDSQSTQSLTTTCSEDVIIEDEQDIILDGDDTSSVKSASSTTSSKKSKACKASKKKKKLPTKTKLRGQNEHVMVTHIVNPHRFMVQLSKDMGKLSSMAYMMQQWCNSPAAKSHKVTGVHVGDIVLARYTMDKQWYRARIKNVLREDDEEADLDEINVEVFYFDFGNTEVMPASRLLNMQTRFMKHPEFSIECSLFNILPKEKAGCWSQEAVQTFAKVVGSKQMLMSIVREENNVMIVDLCKPPDEDIIDDRPVSVRDFLVFMDLANLESSLAQPLPGGAPLSKKNYISPNPKEPGETYGINISYSGLPDCFYVQENGEEYQYLATMMAHIQDTYNRTMKESWHILCPYVGLICVAKFSGDGLWYRARIIELPGHRDVTVQYVDYGNKETLSITKIRKIIDSFLILPAQAVCCSLMDVAPHNSNEGWTAESLRWWADRVNARELYMKVIQVASVLQVVLREPDRGDEWTINMEMVDQGQARSVGKWSEITTVADAEDVLTEHVPRLSYTAGDGSFPVPCDLEHQPVYWKSRNARPVRRYQETVLTPPQSPDRSSDDQRLRPSPATSGPSSPSQHVSRRERQSTQQAEARQQMSQLSPPRTTDSRDSSQGSVKTTPKDGGKKMPNKATKKSDFDKEVVISHFVSPSQFHVQMADAGNKGLDELMNLMQAEYRNSEVAWVSWKQGCYCVVLSPQYGRWYRGVIHKVLQKNLMEVFMLDYGFTEIVSTNNLRSILRQYRHHRCFSFPCHLGGVIPAGGMKDWSKTACEFMQDQIRNKKIFIVKKGNVEKKSLPIDLIIEDYVEETALEPGRKVYLHLTHLMKERGLAIPLPKKQSSSPSIQQVFPVLYYKKAESEVKTGDKVMPVYVDYGAVIHCYTMEGDDLFQSMCDTLHQKFKDSDPPASEQPWEKGQACAAFFSKDSQWHRATILQLEPSTAQIHFIDYGNSEWVEMDQLRADIAEFIDIPQQTFLCTLHDIKPATNDKTWAVPALEYMHKHLVNKYCTITVIEKNGFENTYMTVNLDLEGQDVGSHLVQYGIAQRGEYITDQETQSQQIEQVLMTQKAYKKMPLLPVGSTASVLVTHVELPNIVYMQYVPGEVPEDLSQEEKKQLTRINNDLHKLEQLSMDLNREAHTLPSVPNPKKGLQCCAQFAGDLCWYRAIIVDIYPDTKQYLVLYVDYGNSEVLTLQKIRALTPKFQSLPYQSMRSKLADLYPPSAVVSWTKTSLMEMMSILANKPITAKVIGHKPFTVELYEQSSESLIYQPVIDADYILFRPPSVDTPTLEVEDPLTKEIAETEKMQKETQETDSQKKVTNGVTSDDDDANDTIDNDDDDEVVDEDDETNDDEEEANDDDEAANDDEGEEDLTETTEDACKSTSTKSWADMAEEGSTVDIEELPKFDDDDDVSSQGGTRSGSVYPTKSVGRRSGPVSPMKSTGRRSIPVSPSEKVTKDGDAGATRRKAKLESIINDDECFD